MTIITLNEKTRVYINSEMIQLVQDNSKTDHNTVHLTPEEFKRIITEFEKQ